MLKVFTEQTKTREILAPIHLLAGRRVGALFLFFFLVFLVVSFVCFGFFVGFCLFVVFCLVGFFKLN